MTAGWRRLRLVWIGRQRRWRRRGLRWRRLYPRRLVDNGWRGANRCHLAGRIEGIATGIAHHAIAILQDVVDVLLHGGGTLVALINVAHEGAVQHSLCFRRKLRAERTHRAIDERRMIWLVAVG